MSPDSTESAAPRQRVRATARVTLVTYADRRYYRQQQRCLASAIDPGGFDRVVGRRPHSLDPDFWTSHRAILAEPRGAGLWLWKPQIILDELARIAPGDWLVYSDAGAELIGPIEPLITFAEREGQDVVVFELSPPHPERSWTKRDAFTLLQCDEPRFSDTPQRLSGFSVWRASELARAVAAEWLVFAADRRVLSDDDNVLGAANYPEFRAHRHDQSILSLLTKRHGLDAARDPSQFGWTPDARRRFPRCDYPQIVLSTRLSSPLRLRLEQRLRRGR